MDSYSSIAMCQYWDNSLIYWAVYWLFYWHVSMVTHSCAIEMTNFISALVYLPRRLTMLGWENFFMSSASSLKCFSTSGSQLVRVLTATGTTPEYPAIPVWLCRHRFYGYMQCQSGCADRKNALLKMGSYSSTTMCQYWDNHLIYWVVYWLLYWHVPIITHCCAIVTTHVHLRPVSSWVVLSQTAPPPAPSCKPGCL